MIPECNFVLTEEGSLGSVSGQGESPELIRRGTSFPLPYTRSVPSRIALQMEDLRVGLMTVLE
jgi:hypothetical protein